jgi:hypothetical protein
VFVFLSPLWYNFVIWGQESLWQGPNFPDPDVVVDPLGLDLLWLYYAARQVRQYGRGPEGRGGGGAPPPPSAGKPGK